MGILGVNSNSYANMYYQDKMNTAQKEVVQEETKQEQNIESGKTTTQPPQHNNSVMVNGLPIHVDPTGEIAKNAFWKEKSRQINEAISKVQNYYKEGHEENMTFERPYNHLLNKYNNKIYNIFQSPYFRSDMTEEEREMAFIQERAMLRGEGFAHLSDSYAWASSGGVPNREKQLEDAVQSALDKKRKEMLEEINIKV